MIFLFREVAGFFLVPKACVIFLPQEVAGFFFSDRLRDFFVQRGCVNFYCPMFPSSQVPKFPSSQVPKIPSSQVPKFLSSQVPKFPSSHALKFPSSQVPKFLSSQDPLYQQLRRKKIWKYRNIGKILKLQVTESKNYSEYTIQKNRNYNYENSVLCQAVAILPFFRCNRLDGCISRNRILTD